MGQPSAAERIFCTNRNAARSDLSASHLCHQTSKEEPRRAELGVYPYRIQSRLCRPRQGTDHSTPHAGVPAGLWGPKTLSKAALVVLLLSAKGLSSDPKWVAGPMPESASIKAVKWGSRLSPMPSSRTKLQQSKNIVLWKQCAAKPSMTSQAVLQVHTRTAPGASPEKTGVFVGSDPKCSVPVPR